MEFGEVAGKLRLYDPHKKDWLLKPVEKAEARVQQEFVARQEAEAKAQQAEAETQQEARARQRTEARTNQAEAELIRLRAELERLRTTNE